MPSWTAVPSWTASVHASPEPEAPKLQQMRTKLVKKLKEPKEVTHTLRTLRDTGFMVSVNVTKRDDVGAHAVHELQECLTAELQAEFVEETEQELYVVLNTLKACGAEIAHLQFEVSHATPKGCGGSSKGQSESLSSLPSSSC